MRSRFWGHACVQFDTEDVTVLCDPWFFGDVFNSSWSPLKAIDFDFSSLQKKFYIWISHEHPDHLHFPSLKLIREKVPGEITVLYREQANSNVRTAIESLGFKFQTLPARQMFSLSNALKIYSLPEGTDCALLLREADQSVLNQNDCILGEENCEFVAKVTPRIDCWLFQFSLAGYYANSEDTVGLRMAHDEHLEKIRYYYNRFLPQAFVPFASFVYFSKAGNCYLNSFRVRLEEVLATVAPGAVQIVWYGDEILQKDFDARNIENLAKWKSLHAQDLVIRIGTSVSLDSVREAFQSYAKIFNKFMFRFLLPKVRVLLTDSKQMIVLDLRNSNVILCKKSGKADVEIGDEDFLFFLKFPWGADTLNITGNLRILSPIRWRFFAAVKHFSYVYGHKPQVLQIAAAYRAAIVTSRAYYKRRSQWILRNSTGASFGDRQPVENASDNV